MSEERHEEGWQWRYKKRAFGVFWGLVLILLGIVLFISFQGWITWGEWWQYFLIGLGLIFLIESLVRYTNREYRRPRFGRVIAGLVLIFVGLAFLLGFGKWWPLILIVVGLAVLFNVWLKR